VKFQTYSLTIEGAVKYPVVWNIQESRRNALESKNYNTMTSEMRRLIRKAYEEDQGGICYHCKEVLTGPPSKEIQNKVINKNLFPNGFFNNPVHLHHNHNTGMTIGAVHCKCNAVLWQYHGE
jgi:hypothetical protein